MIKQLNKFLTTSLTTSLTTVLMVSFLVGCLTRQQVQAGQPLKILIPLYSYPNSHYNQQQA